MGNVYFAHFWAIQFILGKKIADFRCIFAHLGSFIARVNKFLGNPIIFCPFSYQLKVRKVTVFFYICSHMQKKDIIYSHCIKGSGDCKSCEIFELTKSLSSYKDFCANLLLANILKSINDFYPFGEIEVCNYFLYHLTYKRFHY